MHPVLWAPKHIDFATISYTVQNNGVKYYIRAGNVSLINTPLKAQRMMQSIWNIWDQKQTRDTFVSS